MTLPLKPPMKPQLARGKDALPEGEGWSYEPKYDGFRAIVFVDVEFATEPIAVRDADVDAVTLLSRGGKPLERYFPEIVVPPGRYVLDGELIIDAASGAKEAEDFDALSNRIHPAQSRIDRLAEETPARYVAFDLLALGDDDLTGEPLAERRAALEDLFGVAGAPGTLGAVLPVTDAQGERADADAALDPHSVPITGEWADGTSVSLAPLVRTAAAAQVWLGGRGEGVVAKELDSPYLPGSRRGMVKVKRLRTIDAVVAGYRPGKEEGTVGSLMLGLYDEAGQLQVIGHTSGLKAKEKRELVETLAPYETGDRGSADPSRWRSDEELQWVALRPELVVEVSFDQVTSGRIRHGTKLHRWREDKAPADCRIDQLDE